jgi:hypothetical protein
MLLNALPTMLILSRKGENRTQKRWSDENRLKGFDEQPKQLRMC